MESLKSLVGRVGPKPCNSTRQDPLGQLSRDRLLRSGLGRGRNLRASGGLTHRGKKRHRRPSKLLLIDDLPAILPIGPVLLDEGLMFLATVEKKPLDSEYDCRAVGISNLHPLDPAMSDPQLPQRSPLFHVGGLAFQGQVSQHGPILGPADPAGIIVEGFGQRGFLVYATWW